MFSLKDPRSFLCFNVRLFFFVLGPPFFSSVYVEYISIFMLIFLLYFQISISFFLFQIFFSFLSFLSFYLFFFFFILLLHGISLYQFISDIL